jgi:hypothetical protein
MKSKKEINRNRVPNRTRGSRVKLREGQQKDAIFEGKIME